MEVRVNNRAVWLVVALVIFGVALRLLPHPDNLAPIGAIALFGGALLPRKHGWWLPLVAVIISDYFIGFYGSMWFTWAAFLLVGLYGMTLRNRSNWFRIPIGAFGSAVIFFIVSNFGVWAEGRLYAHTWAGLVQCYDMALPFFRSTFLGDLLYAGILFGGYALALRLARVATQRSRVW